jgi:hypothetical protein
MAVGTGHKHFRRVKIPTRYQSQLQMVGIVVVVKSTHEHAINPTSLRVRLPESCSLAEPPPHHEHRVAWEEGLY